MTTLALDIETLCPEEHRAAIAEMAGERDPEAFGALCPPLARVVCVCVAAINGADEITKELALYDISASESSSLAWINPPIGAEACHGEGAMLKRLASILAKADRLVTFNGSSFDIPTLLLRSMAHGIHSPVLLAAHQEYRYKPDLNYDVREQFSNFGRFRDGALRAFCLGLGLPDPKAEGDGAHVSDLVARGDAESLVRYCRGDVRATASLYKAWRAFHRAPVPALVSE